MFDLAKYINALHTSALSITYIEKTVWQEMKRTYTTFIQDILGLGNSPEVEAIGLIEGLLALYKQAKAEKNYKQVDGLRLLLKKQGILVQDGKSSVSWVYG